MNKKWLWLGALLGFFTFMCFGSLFATPSVWLSSMTTTADTNGTLCGQYGSTSTIVGIQNYRGFLHGVCISSTTVGSSIQIYASSFTNTGATIGPIDTSNWGCEYFDVQTSSGMDYTKTGTAKVDILYQCY